MKIVYAVPFEPVVRSRSILGLCLPSSASGNCEWPLPVHWNCLFVSNQGAFNVSRVSSRSALIKNVKKWQNILYIVPVDMAWSSFDNNAGRISKCRPKPLCLHYLTSNYCSVGCKIIFFFFDTWLFLSFSLSIWMLVTEQQHQQRSCDCLSHGWPKKIYVKHLCGMANISKFR